MAASAGRWLALGVAHSGLSPQKLTSTIGTGIVIGATHLAVGETFVAIAVFPIVAASTVIVSGHRGRSGPVIEGRRQWLIRRDVLIVAIALLDVGGVLLRNSIESTSG